MAKTKFEVRRNLQSTTKPKISTLNGRQRAAKRSVAVETSAKRNLAGGEQRFHLQVALELSGHVAYFGERSPECRHISVFIVKLALSSELPPVLDELVSALGWSGAQLRLSLERVNSTQAGACRAQVGQTVISRIGTFGIAPTKGRASSNWKRVINMLW